MYWKIAAVAAVVAGIAICGSASASGMPPERALIGAVLAIAAVFFAAKALRG